MPDSLEVLTRRAARRDINALSPGERVGVRAVQFRFFVHAQDRANIILVIRCAQREVWLVSPALSPGERVGVRAVHT